MHFSSIVLGSLSLLCLAAATPVASPKYNVPMIIDIPTLTDETAKPNKIEKRAGPTFSSIGADLQKPMLDTHNKYRKIHGVLNVTWSSTLADAALVTAKKCVFAHTNPYKYGENIAGGSDGYNDPAFFVQLWYNEFVYYDYNNPGFSESAGHFTQVVWKSTEQIGCAWVKGCSGPNTYSNLLYCEYSPNGNIIGYFEQNVLRPVSSPSTSTTSTKTTSSTKTPTPTSPTKALFKVVNDAVKLHHKTYQFKNPR